MKESTRQMRTGNRAVNSDEYGRLAVVSHWLIAASIFFLFASSWWMLGLPLPSQELTFRKFPFQLHKNIGITLVIILFVLLYARLRHTPTTEESGKLRPWMRRLAALDHILLYVLILAVCVSGYMSSSYSGWATTLWWSFELPYWGREDEELNIFWSNIHLWTCWMLLAVITMHMAGALYHAFKNDGIARRMLH